MVSLKSLLGFLLIRAYQIVQARMWAQGLTVGLMIAAGALTHSKRAEALQHVNTDHSWRDLVRLFQK